MPNLDILESKPPELQTLFMWICVHADEEGVCYPSRRTLSKKCGVGIKTIDKYIKELEKLQILIKTERKKENSKENKSNLYQICEPNTLDRDSELLQIANLLPHPSEPGDTVTISNITIPIITIDKQQVASKIIGVKTLPVDRGDTPLKRINSIYNTLFFKEYGINDNQSMGLKMKIFKSLLVDYTELQLAYLLIVYFTWKGMDGNNTRDREFLVSNTHAITLFKGQLNKYVAWVKNVSGYDKEFENSDELLPIIGKYIISLTQ